MESLLQDRRVGQKNAAIQKHVTFGLVASCPRDKF